MHNIYQTAYKQKRYIYNILLDQRHVYAMANMRLYKHT